MVLAEILGKNLTIKVYVAIKKVPSAKAENKIAVSLE